MTRKLNDPTHYQRQSGDPLTWADIREGLVNTILAPLRWLYRTFIQKHVHVEDNGYDYVVEEKNIWQAFVDDSVRYGFKVAWHNFKAFVLKRNAQV